MPRRPRDHQAEYARRIARGLAKGLSRSQARGHSRPGETAARVKSLRPISDERMQTALQALRKEKSLTKAAKSVGISPERLRRYANEKGAIEKTGRRWRIRSNLPRRMKLFSNGRELYVVLSDFDSASIVGRYLHAVRVFLDTNRTSVLASYSGKSVQDIAGKTYPFETRPNVLYRLASSGDSTFEQIYRLVL